MKKMIMLATIAGCLYLASCTEAGEAATKQADFAIMDELENMVEAAYGEEETDESAEYETAVITKISDGDTITVELQDGTTGKVRFLEVDTPESVHSDESKNSSYGELASEYTKGRISVGQTVYLTKDTSDTDRYGRLLRMVWLEAPDDPYDEEELRAKCLNAQLLLDGYARVAIYDDYAYEEVFEKFQEEAMESRIGLWADESWWEYYEENYS